jgi:hypothetical protein
MLGSLGAESLGKSVFEAPAVARIRPTRALIRPKARFASTAQRLDTNVSRAPRGEVRRARGVRASAANASR